MKLLGIDYGRRRIGIAATDPTGIIIKGITTIDRQKTANIFDTLKNIILNEKVELVVWGVPLGPDDEETVMSREIRNFAKKFRKAEDIKLPFYFVDESFSSREADNYLTIGKKKKRKDKKNRDRIAACNILVNYQREIQ